jgi:hypothetical protein
MGSPHKVYETFPTDTSLSSVSPVVQPDYQVAHSLVILSDLWLIAIP